MLGIIISKKDEASLNISRILLSSYKWKERHGIYINDDRLLYFIENEHIYHDNVDKEIEKLGYNIDTIIFASRHSSKIAKKTLSVHPIGNFGKAEYGGKDATLIKTNPLLMRNALQLIKEKNKMDYEICYEATHHGPYVEKPTFFIEVGSTPKEWNDMKACKIIAEAIMEMNEKNYKAAIGIGGGHYAPRFTDIALKKGVAFGHIAAKYAIDNLNESMLKKMIETTLNCKMAYFHGEYPEIKEMIKNFGIEIV